MTQHQRIIDYITRFGSISPMQAFMDLGITKLATRVSEMRRDERYKDIPISMKMVEARNRFGEKVKFATYSLEKEDVKNG